MNLNIGSMILLNYLLCCYKNLCTKLTSQTPPSCEYKRMSLREGKVITNQKFVKTQKPKIKPSPQKPRNY